MSDFGVRTDIQQTHVIAVVVINVLLGSADSVEKLGAWMMIMAAASRSARGGLVELPSSCPDDGLCWLNRLIYCHVGALSL